MRTLLTLLGTVVTGGLLWTQSAVEIPDEPLARIQVVWTSRGSRYAQQKCMCRRR
jgi:hypothetical protein